MENKRKTHTSTEVKNRHIKKTYNRYIVSLRKDRDAELIEKIEELKSSGCETTEAFLKIIKEGI